MKAVVAIQQSLDSGRASEIHIDAESQTLTDLYSKHTLQLADLGVSAVDALISGDSKVVLGDVQRFVVLSRAGLAFAPSFESTGPLPQMPALVTFRDLSPLLGQARDGLSQSGPLALQTVQAVVFSLAIVDGARIVGFDVTAQEAEVEAMIEALEARVAVGLAAH